MLSNVPCGNANCIMGDNRTLSGLLAECVPCATSAEGITVLRAAAHEDVSSHIGSGYSLRKLVTRTADLTCRESRDHAISQNSCILSDVASCRRLLLHATC
jgi:hypothetical protein